MFLKILLILVVLSTVCNAQVRVIFDTDLDSDVDDVQALAMLHAYRQAGIVDLLGVVVTSDDSFSFACADALNTYYGQPGLPLGFLKMQDSLRSFSKYTRQLADEFPHAVTPLDQTTESATLYRKLLAASPDNSVVLVTVGHLTSLQNLLQSPPDAISTLTGQELAKRKVKRWLCMGGQYPTGKEANFYRPDPQSTVYCLDVWDQEVVFCGWEVGKEILTGGTYLKSKLPENNPIYRAYQLYNNFAGRPAWDQVAVLLLDEKAEQYFELETNGYVEVAPDGSNTWKAGEKKAGKNHAYVKIRAGTSPETIARYMDELSMLEKSRDK